MAKIYTTRQAQVSINTILPENQQDCDKEYSPRQMGNGKIDVIDQEFKLHSEKSIKRFKCFTRMYRYWNNSSFKWYIYHRSNQRCDNRAYLLV